MGRVLAFRRGRKAVLSLTFSVLVFNIRCVVEMGRMRSGGMCCFYSFVTALPVSLSGACMM